MANFNVTTLLGYSLKKEYVGTMNYRNVITLNVETLHRTSTDPRYDINNYTGNNVPIQDYEAAEIFQKNITPIILNGNGFGVGRVISISEPRGINYDENGLTFWKRNVTIELYEAGDSSNIPNSAQNTFYARLKDVIFDPQIISLSEDFSFTDDEQGVLGYTQTINIACADVLNEESPNDKESTGVYKARDLAQKLIESEVNFGFAGNLSLLAGKPGKKTYSTNVDVINGSVSITKTFTSFFVKTPASYSFQVQDDGSITISETVALTNKNLAQKSNEISNIISILNNVLDGSYSRCRVYFNAYKAQIFTSSNVDDLVEDSENIHLITNQRSFDEKSQQYVQTSVYSNARNLRVNFVLEINQSISSDETGIVTISENADFVNKAFKIKSNDTSFLGSNYFGVGSTVKTVIDSEMTNALVRAQNLYKLYYDTASTPSLKLLNSSRKASIRGKTFGYSCSFTNDSSLLKSNGINQVTSVINVNLPKKISNSYIVPGIINQKVFVQESEQSTVGEMSISQKARLTRNNSNKNPDLVSKPTSSIQTMYSNCLLTLLNRLTGFGGGSPNNFVVRKVTFSYNSSREVNVSVTINYLVAATRGGPKTNLYSN